MAPASHASHGRLYALDGLRAVMMLLGIVLHTATSFMVFDLGDAWPYKDPATTLFADLAVGIIHLFRMPVFFALAGFFAVLLYMRRGAPGLLRNRLERIGIPLVAGIILLYPLVVSGFVFSNAAKGAPISEALESVGAIAQTHYLYVPASTMHLWFLYDLLYFYALALLIAWACKGFPASWRSRGLRLFAGLVRRPVLRVLILGLITAATLLPIQGVLATLARFQPDFSELIAYGIFFGFGWLLYFHRELLQGFERLAWLQTILAPALWVVSEGVLANGVGATEATIVRSLVGGIAIWMFFFGLTGLFIRYLDKPSARIRYVVDASYWVYLIHLPFTIWIPGLLVGTGLSVWFRMLTVLAVTTFACFVTYDLFVRSSFVGRVLNGRRYTRGLPVE